MEQSLNKTPQHVALIIETSKGFGRGLLHGISRYVRTHSPWSIYVDERGLHDAPPTWLRNWKGDGIIVRAHTPRMAEVAREVGVPVVDTLHQLRNLDFAAVYSDDQAIAQMAAEHLLDRHFRNFAFVGVERSNWSRRRQDAFAEAIRDAGCTCHVYSPLSRRRFRESWEGGQDDLAEWLDELPKPVAVMAAHDLRALCVLDACRRIDLAVPEQIAIIGVDNDDVLCELADPPLTSVAHQLDRIGHEAASLLDRMMAGEDQPEEPLFVPPSRIVTRRSTDVVAISDPIIAAALRFIREHACDGISVQQVVRHTGLSRRALERGFTKYFSSTPHEQIVQLQLSRVRQLLTETEFTLEEIAIRAGFSSSAYLSVLFKKRTQQTPGEYRRAIHSSES